MPIIDNNPYYLSKDITIFPSSNAVDSGKLFTEANGRNININITQSNYVVSQGGFDLSFSEIGSIIVAPGKAILEGFEITTTDRLLVPIRSDYDTGTYYVCLKVLYGSNNNIQGNLVITSDDDTEEKQYYCGGVTIVLTTEADYNNNKDTYLLLGYVDKDAGGKQTVTINKNKYTRISADNILINLKGYNKNGYSTEILPPNQEISLTTFVNEIMQSYYLSKGGDNEYNEVIFRAQPKDYSLSSFNKSSESLLNNNNYSIKLDMYNNYLPTGKEEENNPNGETSKGQGGTLQIKTNTDSNNTKNIAVRPDSILFFKGNEESFKNIDTTGSEPIIKYNYDSKIENKTNLSSAVFSGSSNLSIGNKNGGQIKLYSKEDTGSNLIVEHNEKNHDDVIETGDLVYASSKDYILGDERILNYLFDSEGNIKTTGPARAISSQNKKQYLEFVKMSPRGNIEICTSILTYPYVLFTIRDPENGEIKQEKTISLTDEGKLDLDNDVIISSKNTDKGNLQVEGFIAVSDKSDISKITVPDYANGNGSRSLKKGDIYTDGQCWSAVYNDVAEIFAVPAHYNKSTITGLFLAVNNKNPDEYVLADKNNNCVVGIVSENPAFCCGGQDCENGVPVALAGRVKVKYEGKTPKIGDYITLSKKTPGYATKTKNRNKAYGKIVKLINTSTVEVIVML